LITSRNNSRNQIDVIDPHLRRKTTHPRPAKEPDLVVRFIRALAKSMQLIKGNRDKAIQLVTAKLRGDPEMQRRALGYFAQDLDVAIERENIAALLGALGIKGDPEHFFERSYLARATATP
jgi:ABC-type nitrate/sulfonate/bicarbonate transport system substrate-binding protein